MPDIKMKIWHWDLCALCSGDGVANMAADEDGNVEEGVCPVCEGKGWVKIGGYYELNVSQFKALLGL